MKTITLSGLPLNLSPKLAADLFATIAGYLLTKYGVGLDADMALLIGKAIGSIAGFIANPGHVAQLDTPPASDAIDQPDQVAA